MCSTKASFRYLAVLAAMLPLTVAGCGRHPATVDVSQQQAGSPGTRQPTHSPEVKRQIMDIETRIERLEVD